MDGEKVASFLFFSFPIEFRRFGRAPHTCAADPRSPCKGSYAIKVVHICLEEGEENFNNLDSNHQEINTCTEHCASALEYMEPSRWAALRGCWTTASPCFYSNWDTCNFSQLLIQIYLQSVKQTGGAPRCQRAICVWNNNSVWDDKAR